MLNRYSCLVALIGLSLLGGCTLLSESEPPPPPVTSAEFQARIDRLEGAVTTSCMTGQQARLDQQLHQQQALSADVRQVGSLLRQLRGDVAQLGSRGQAAASDDADCPPQLDLQGDKTVLGSSEWIGLPSVGTFLEARIDTGAKTSSLSARNITPFERDGEDWVRFKLGLNDGDEAVPGVRDSWIEAPVVRRVKIIQASGEATRPVIRQLMTLGPIRQHVEFTLNDRTHLEYPVLLGRRFLLDIAVVDVARRHVHEKPTFEAPPSSPDSSDTDSAPAEAGGSH